MRIVPVLVFLLMISSCEPKKEGETADFPTTFELSEGTETAAYDEIIRFYIELAREFPQINVQTIGETDSGLPLQLVTYNPDSEFNFQKIGRDKLILLINNGIHPGESDGIDATMLLFRDLALQKITAPEHLVLATIPVYNVGGALNRNATTRVNQNGPRSYGFRGNARNYDLNRDFIKSDSRNARTFARIFHMLEPHVFIDTHVSNGADYQYTLSYLATQHHKLGEPLGSFLNNNLIPRLKDSLSTSGWELTPYVNVYERPPDQGFAQFLDTPRYSTGYASLWGTLGLMIETHMLKPYGERVKATYAFLTHMVKIIDSEHENIRQLREDTRQSFMENNHYPLSWKVDSTLFTPMEFKGFEADTVLSELTGLPRLQYNREAPFTRVIRFRDHYRATDSVEVPAAYVVPKSWSGIMEFMDLNQVSYSTFDRDSMLLAESYYVDTFHTLPYPYEGHYLHFDTRVSRKTDSVMIKEGDFLIPTKQPAFRYLLETLEPSAVDSFFNWNYFDPILQRKEGFSSYVFEDLAQALLKENDSLRKEFEHKKASDKLFAAQARAQLEWIYERSPYSEAAYRLYPILRIPKSNSPKSGI